MLCSIYTIGHSIAPKMPTCSRRPDQTGDWQQLGCGQLALRIATV